MKTKQNFKQYTGSNAQALICSLRPSRAFRPPLKSPNPLPPSLNAMARLLLILVIAGVCFAPSLSQTPPPDPGCNGVLLSYNLDSSDRIRPFLTDTAAQPSRFTATATVLNSGTVPLLSWSLSIAFASREVLVSVDGATLSDSNELPFNTTSSHPTSSTSFTGSDLKTPIATAGDISQIQAQIKLVGTLFGPAAPPSSLSLSDPSLLCPAVNGTTNATTGATSFISTCCVPDPSFKPNATDPSRDTLAGGSVLPRRSGDLTIDYDIIQAYPDNYLAQVALTNHHPLGRLDAWRLSFDWTRGEFIFDMRGAYTNVSGAAECIFGEQGVYYKDFDFTKVVNCQRRPTILDLPAAMANDTDVGRIPNCCRNGTILPAEMDPSQSSSRFQLQVYKMPPDLNRTAIFPPGNWRVSGGALNPDYRCTAASRVAAAKFPDPSGLSSESLAIASWQVVCNITKPPGAAPKCCVSFSGYYNESVVPCRTCACGCAAAASRTCNATAPALLLPPQALLVPFDNRTDLATEWADQKHFDVPKTLPCSDACGVSINWHVNSDYRGGWTARMTLFNWDDDVSYADWFAAVEMARAYDGYEEMYSFNGTKMGGDTKTIFMQGLPGLNYLVAEVNGSKPDRDPRVPGKQQSVISFTKKGLPEIDVVAGDGFPTRVVFNGEECSLPEMIPSRGFRSSAGWGFSLYMILAAAAALLLLQQ